MQAGKLSRVIFVERLVEAKNEFHSIVSTWTTVGTVRAEVVQHAVNEAETEYGEAGTAGVTFRTRYFNGLTTADRIRFLGRYFNVKAITELGIRAGLEIKGEAIE